ncbi:MAG: tetratricopeptide repeat protein [Planctomycetales bacterium]|nr:tetratricopeptide repeat protein [Planctomycetales bacterium]
MSAHPRPGAASQEPGSGRAFLTDFGLAKTVATGSRLTRTGEALGTPAYMSPEQARGEVSALTPATDVWSLGCVLYEIAAGRAPFGGDTTAAVIGRILALEPPRLRKVRGDAPAPLERLLRVCLSKRSPERYPDAAGLREDLDRVLRGERQRARLPGSRRRMAAAGAILLAAGTAAAAVAWPHEPASRPPAAGAPERPEADVLVSRARVLRRADPAGAADLLRRLTESSSAAPDLVLERAECLREAGRWREADAEYGRVLEAAPGRLDARVGRGLARWVGRQVPGGRMPDPWEDLEAASAGESGWRTSLARAILAYSRKDWPEGEREAQAAGDEPAALLIRGLLRHHEGQGRRADQEAAIRDFSAAIALCPGLALAWFERGHARDRLGDVAGAMGDYSRAIELDPRDPTARINRGAVLAARGDHAAALSDFDRAIELDPRGAVAWSNRALVRGDRGDHAGALADFGRALELDAKCAEAWYERGLLRKRLGDLTGAIADFEKALGIRPAYADAWNDRGAARKALGEVRGAMEDYTKAIECDPRHAKAWSNRGIVKMELGDRAGALEDHRRAVEADPGYARGWLNRGVVRSAQGDVDGAIEDYGRALVLDPRFPEAWSNRAAARKWQGDLAGAIADYGKALEVAPEGWSRRAAVEKALAGLRSAPAGGEAK